MKVHYIIPLNYRLTGQPENFKIKLYYFRERLSLFIYLSIYLSIYLFLAKKLTSKRNYFLKSIPEFKDSLFYFVYYRS